MYQALYRQYRPKTFDELLGQSHITTTLKNQIRMGNIGHAYLFSGTRGTGKTSAAKIFSRAVNCLNPQDGNPCNECENCQGILDETIMDVIEMDAASHNSVEDIRDLRDKVVYPPSKVAYKVYIIDEVHMLSKSAFNALLKTLEEPPKHLIFLLATTEPERLPQTILSRCQRFDFRRITKQDMVLNMKKIIQDMDIQVDDRVLNLIASNSDGAMRDALSLLDQCISFSGERLDYEVALAILGIANKDLIFQMVDDIKRKDLEAALKTIDEIIYGGKDINQFIKDLINHYRNLMVVKASKDYNAGLDLDNIDNYIGQSKSMDMDYILRSLEILTEAESQAKWSTQPRVLLELATIKLVNIEEELSLLDRIEKLEAYIGSSGAITKSDIISPSISKERPVEKPVERKQIVSESKKEEPMPKEDKNQEEATKPTRIDANQTLTLEVISREWQNVLQKIKTSKISLYALIVEGELVSFDNNLLTISYKEGYAFHLQAISKRDNKEFIEKIISTHFNQNIGLRFIIESQGPKSDNVNKENNKDESIKEAMNFFGEDIVEIK